MRELAEKNYSTATELADTLVRECGIPFRTAHGIVGEVVRISIERNKNMDEVIGEVLAKYGLELDKSKIEKALNPMENVKMRKVIGGPAPEEVERAMSFYSYRINNYEKEVNEKINKMISIREKLLNL
jgi:argininosuccinate lyase